MITGTHVVLYSQDAEADRAFFRDVLACPHVDAGHGWLIFRLPPAELAVHPGGEDGPDLYLTCDDLDQTIQTLTARKVEFTGPVTEQRWGRATTFRLPGGSRIGLYEPRHPTAYDLDA